MVTLVKCSLTVDGISCCCTCEAVQVSGGVSTLRLVMRLGGSHSQSVTVLVLNFPWQPRASLSSYY
jgi:hypothetical protein